MRGRRGGLRRAQRGGADRRGAGGRGRGVRPPAAPTRSRLKSRSRSSRGKRSEALGHVRKGKASSSGTLLIVRQLCSDTHETASSSGESTANRERTRL